MDEVDWTLPDARTTVIASGGGYTTLAVTEVVNGTTGPYTFNITSGGSFDDNVANYSISCNGNELASGIVIGAFWGGSGVASSADICCIDGFCSTDVEVFAAQGDCDAVVNYVVPLAADNCPGVTLTQTSGLPSGATFPSGNTTITYEAEDAAGNVSTCTFKVTVFETTPPIAVCQDVTAYLDATGNVTITAAQADGGSTDNCGIDSLSLSRYTFSCRDVGVHTIQLFVTDLSGNLDACNLTVTILDTIAYQIICPSDVVVSNDMGQCGAVVNFNAPTTYDNCADTVRLSHSFNDDILDGNSVACVNGFGHADNSYLRVYDLNQFGYGIGNDFDVTNVQFGVELAVGAGGSQPAVVNLYTLSGPLTYANLTLVATQNITIPDQSETLFNLPITATIPGGSTLVVELFTPNGQSVGNFFYIGSNSYSQTDLSYGVFPDCGPYSEPTDMAVVGYPSMEIILNVLSVPSETVTQIAGLPSGSTFPVGTSVVTFAADNGSGSTDTCSFNVIVNDTELPIAVCQNVTVYLDTNGSASITTADVNNGSTDNCVIDTITLSKEVFNCSEIGVNTVTLSVTDTSGNVGVCTATITVLDTTAPVAVCKNATVYLDANGAVTVLGTDVDGGATDNCAVSSITVSPNSFTCADRDSTYQVLVTFADASGNASSCNATVTIADTLRPVALCQNLTIQLDSTGNATITVAQINNGSYDNCNIASVTISQSVFTCANIGANTVTLSVADSSGNVGTCDAIVTVDPSATIDSFTLSNYNGYNVSCYGSADGTATVHTTSVFPVTYLWSNGQTSQTATALAAGQYFVTVTAGTCEFVDSVTLTQPDSLTINPVLSDYNGFGVRCFGSNDGTITLNVTGGVPTYNYAWPSSSAIGNSYTANGLLPGVYNITVTDLNGCTKVTSPELTQPTQVHTSISAVAPKCNGGTDGTATVVASGGTSVFTYLWNTVPAQTSATATGLGAGTYTVTVSDGNGCTSVNSITIAQPAALVAIAQGTSNFNGYGVSCFGGNNGTGSVTVIGGTSPFSYAWSGGTVSGNTVTGLASGTFTVTITDANGCSAVDSITVTQPSRITATATVTSNFNGAQISCNGATDGQLTANGNGGVAPYFYEWNTTPVQTSKVATGVGAGTYIVTITDLNGCTDTASVTISAPAAITATGAVTSNFNGFGVSCFGGNNGAATVTATGGTGTLNYAWPSASGVGNTANGTGLAAGTYVVTVTDTNACSATVSITVTQPTEITAVPSVVDAKCFGANDGKAWVTVSGGVPGYTYSWSTSPAQTTDTASNLLAGTYTVVVSDQNGCSSTITVVVNEPALLVADANGEGVTCPNGNDGEATATATGGTAPYSFAWNTTPPQTGTTATGLTEGTYTVTVTDANGCTATDTAVIIVKYPTLPTATLSGGGAVCADEPRPDVFVTFTGFPPYNFTLSNGTTTTNYTGVTQSPFVVAGASAGTYTVTNFSDAHCTGTVSGTAVVKVNPVPSVVVTGGGFVCDGERLPSVEVEFTGTAPWDVVIRIPEGRDTLITNVTASPLVFNPESEGFYIVRSVSDSNGCVAFNLNATKEVGFFLLPLVDAGEPKTVDKGFSVKLDGKVITAYGGVVNYEWTPDTSLNNAFIEQPMARPFETTLYTLTATDKNNCKASDTVTVTVSDRIIIDVINVFTPDGDGVNEFFVIRNRDAFDVLELTILNRWEQIIYESDNYANNWDGTWKGKPVDDGTYYYVIKDVASGKIVKGAVTILRNNE
jgi:gliding motility-associated-like protein